MADKNLYKIIALGIAIFTYLLLIFSVVEYIKEDAKIKKDYGFNVDEAIVVNIDSLLPDKPKPVEQPKPKPIELPKPEVKPVEKPLPKEIVEPIILPPDPKPVEEKQEEKVPKESRAKETKSAKDLFSTVRTDDYAKSMEEKRKQEAARASRLKQQKAEAAQKRAEAKKRKELQKKRALEAQKLVQEMQISTPSTHQKSGEKHEFWSFVSSKIMSKWERTISTQDGLAATVTIRIDNKGRLTYSDLKSSYNSLFDTKLKVFLDNLEYERFPSYKQGSFIEAEFEFKDQEKGL
ncbi:MAG: TonB C-terminal domain-containing protein [Epsilonproteobacteria bacterium]|nr:TonB C-terminal domain-containing protein [Campylobacterota bacterium]